YGIEDMGCVDAETEATDVLEFSGLNVPGLLQTEEYIPAQLSAGASRSAITAAGRRPLRLKGPVGPAVDLPAAVWRKGSRSSNAGSNDACVELARPKKIRMLRLLPARTCLRTRLHR